MLDAHVFHIQHRSVFDIFIPHLLFRRIPVPSL